MTPDLELRRRALQIYYRRYVAADRAWQVAQTEAMSWFPVHRRPSVPFIGDPGSPLRRLHDRRERALSQLAAAHQKLRSRRQRTVRHVRILALPRP